MTTEAKRIGYLPPNDGTALLWGDDRVTFKVRGDDTDGAYCVLLLTIQPGGGPGYLHRDREAETFFVVAGTFDFGHLDDAGGLVTFRAAPGSVVHLPPGVPRGSVNVGATPGTLLRISAPAIEGFFTEMSTVMAPGHPPDMAAAGPIFAKYGCFPVPVLSAPV